MHSGFSGAASGLSRNKKDGTLLQFVIRVGFPWQTLFTVREPPCKRLRPVFLMTAFVLPGNETNSSTSRPEKAGRIYFHRDSQDGVSKREVAATPAARGMWTTRKCRGSIETCSTFQYKDILSPGYLRVLVPLSARTWGQAHSYMGIKAHLL